MPTYEYACDSCSFRFEKRQRFDEEPIIICPKCEREVRRVFHSAPIIFKGSGFYVTDSRNTDVTQGEAKQPAKKQRTGK